MIDLAKAEAGLHVVFQDKTLLLRALTHRSYINENPDFPLEDNERLEFLGDAVLDYVAADYLYHHYPEMREGQLTSLRAALVRTETLARFAQQIRLAQFINLGRGEEENGGRSRPAILCDCYEALIGAICLDQGLDTARGFFLKTLVPAAREVIASEGDRDAKSQLQELSQKYLQATPTYRTIEERGPDHAREFTVAAVINDRIYGEGTGRSKQAAAQAAAQVGLAYLENEILFENPDEPDE